LWPEENAHAGHIQVIPILVAAAVATGTCDPSAGVLCEPEVGEEPLAETAAPAGPSEWHGGKTLLVDGVSLALVLAMPAVGATGFVFGGPGLHLSHGRAGIALLDLGLRVGLTVGGLWLGSQTCHAGEEFTGPCSGVLYVAAAGALAAALIDAFVLAYAPAPAPAPPSEAKPSVTPSMSIWEGRDRIPHPPSASARGSRRLLLDSITAFCIILS